MLVRDAPAASLSTHASRREILLAAIFAVAVTVIMLYPLSLHPGSLGRADTADGQFNIWNVTWVARTIAVDPAHLFDANIFYPHRGTLAYSEANLGAGLLAVPGYWLTRSPYVAYNSAAILMFMLTVLATWALVRHLTGSPGAAAVSAICFAFCPYIFSKTAEIQLMMTAGFPATMLVFHRFVDRPAMGRAVVLGLAIAATGLFCAYYGTFDGLMVAWAALLVSATRGLWRSLRYWLLLATGAAVSVLGVLPFFLPYLSLEQTNHFSRAFEDSLQWSANWPSYVASGARADQWMLAHLHGWTDVLFPGGVVIVLATLGVAAALRRPDARLLGRPRPRSRSREVALLYGSIAILAAWLSFGPRGGLYMIPYKLLPWIFALLRAPSRFGVLVVFALAVLAGLGVAALQQWAGRPRFVAVVACVAALLDLSVVLPVTAAVPIPAGYQALAQLPPGPLLELPIFWRPLDRPRNSIYMLFSTETGWRPIVGGYSDYTPPDYETLPRILSEFPTPESFARLKALDVHYVVFHPGLYYSQAGLAAVRDRLTQFAPYLRAIRTDQDLWVYEITAWPHD